MNHINKFLEIFLLAVTAIIVCVIAYLGLRGANEGKEMINKNTTQIKEINGEYSEMDKAAYDNTNVLGSVLVNLIKNTVEEKEYLAIVVKTNANTTGTHYNYYHSLTDGVSTINKTGTFVSAVSETVTDTSYINPDAQFIGKVYKDVNNVIVCIEFKQLD